MDAWQIVVSLITALGTFIGTVWGIIQYYDKKRDRNIENVIKGAVEPINKKLDSLDQQHKDRDKQISMIQTSQDSMQSDLNDMRKELDIQRDTIFDNEMNRLQTTIMNYAQDIRNGHRMTLNSYNYLCHAYDRYKSLGGNSYVDSEMNFIREEFNKFEKELKEETISNKK